MYFSQQAQKGLWESCGFIQGMHLSVCAADQVQLGG